MAAFELFGTASCPHTREMREWLEWKGYEFVEYDVDADHAARTRMLEISRGQRTVPLFGGRWNRSADRLARPRLRGVSLAHVTR